MIEVGMVGEKCGMVWFFCKKGWSKWMTLFSGLIDLSWISVEVGSFWLVSCVDFSLSLSNWLMYTTWGLNDLGNAIASAKTVRFVYSARQLKCAGTGRHSKRSLELRRHPLVAGPPTCWSSSRTGSLHGPPTSHCHWILQRACRSLNSVKLRN